MAIPAGVLELFAARVSSEVTKDRGMLTGDAIGEIVIGIGMMEWVLAGAAVLSAVGIAAARRGVSLTVSSIQEQANDVQWQKERGNRARCCLNLPGPSAMRLSACSRSTIAPGM